VGVDVPPEEGEEENAEERVERSEARASGLRHHRHQAVFVPPTVISETRIVGSPTPTGTLWPAF
jgi:hypothetical protein